MKEIESISKAENIKLPDNIVDSSYLMAKNFPYETKTSFQRDFELKDKLDGEFAALKSNTDNGGFYNGFV